MSSKGTRQGSEVRSQRSGVNSFFIQQAIDEIMLTSSMIGKK